jgi:hypothetical protein
MGHLIPARDREPWQVVEFDNAHESPANRPTKPNGTIYIVPDGRWGDYRVPACATCGEITDRRDGATRVCRHGHATHIHFAGDWARLKWWISKVA